MSNKNPSKGDWCNLVNNDMAMIGLYMSNGDICGKTRQEFKTIVKTHVKSAAFNSLKCLQDQHKKIKHIKYSQFKIQEYMKSSNFSSEEMSTLFNMRADTINSFKMCFPSVYRNNKTCKLLCSEEEDSISHIFKCKALNKLENNTNPQYEAMFSEIISQKQAVSRLMILQCSRVSLLQSDTAYQGIILDTCAPAKAGGAGERP